MTGRLAVVLALVVALVVPFSAGASGNVLPGGCSVTQTLTINNSIDHPPSPLFGGGTSSGPYGIAVDASGNIYVADPTSNTAYQFDSDGNQTLTFQPLSSPWFTDPDGIAVDAGGNVYVGNPDWPASIQKFSSFGARLGWILRDDPEPLFRNPRGIAVDDTAGLVYFAESGGGVARIYETTTGLSPVGVLVDNPVPDPDFNAVGGVAVDTDGNIFVAGNYNAGASSYQGIVYKFSPSGTQLDTLENPVLSMGTNGVAVDDDGNIYVSDDGTGVGTGADGTAAVYGFRPTGELFLTINNSSTAPSPLFVDPHYIAVDGSGQHLYVSDRWSRTVYRFEIRCNQPPVADPNGPYLFPLNAGPFDGSGSTDPDGDSLTYAWDFGDATAGTGVAPSHIYSDAEIYDVCLTVNDGSVDSPQVCTSTVIYDPSAGFVTGGGWFDSPAGAYKADAELEGKASFGFVARYKKGASIPDGSSEFQLKAGDLNFHSSSYDWLVVTGNDFAKFKGVGTINGEGEYKFQISAGDGTPDTFRIKIWTETGGTEAVIYDNGMNQPISGGSIVIHIKKK